MNPGIVRLTAAYIDFDCVVSLCKYRSTNATAINLIAADTEHNQNQDVFPGEPIGMATVNDDDVKLGENEVLLKGWSENEGLPKALEKAGVVTLTDRKHLFDHGCYGIVAILNEQYRQAV